MRESHTPFLRNILLYRGVVLTRANSLPVQGTLGNVWRLSCSWEVLLASSRWKPGMGAAAQPTALDGPTRFSDPKCQQCGGQEALVTVYIVNLRIVSCFGEAALIQNNKSLGHR